MHRLRPNQKMIMRAIDYVVFIATPSEFQTHEVTMSSSDEFDKTYNIQLYFYEGWVLKMHKGVEIERYNCLTIKKIIWKREEEIKHEGCKIPKGHIEFIPPLTEEIIIDKISNHGRRLVVAAYRYLKKTIGKGRTND